MFVLFIDDDQDNYRLFSDALGRTHDEAVCVHQKDGVAAIEYLLALPPVELPDYIFLDVNMPGMTGTECLLKLKSLPRLKSIPVIIFSSAVHANDAISYAVPGAMGTIVKPCTFNGILKIVKNLA